MAWQCPGCKDYVENGRIACTTCGTTRGGLAVAGRPARDEPVADGRRDLAMEGHLAATALWYRIGGALGGVLLVLGWLRGHAEGYGEPLSALVLGGGACALLFLLGVGLARLSMGARLLAGVLALLGLGGTVLDILRGHHATAWSAVFSICWSLAYLWLFFSPRAQEVTRPAYRALVAQTPSQKPRTWSSPFFWLPLVAFGLMVVAVVWFLGVAALTLR